MNKGLIFLCLSCGILFLTIVTICNAPIITHTIDADDWGVQNCQYYADNRKSIEDNKDLTKDQKDKQLESNDKEKHLCDRKKAMYGLEYAALILDLVFGFSCTLLSLLHFFGVGKSFEKLTGIIGLICGVIGFIFTLIYIIYSGYIFTNDEPGKIPKLEKNREIAKWNGDENKYECIFYEKEDDDLIYIKWNDLGKKQYNYHKDFSFPDENSKYEACSYIDFWGDMTIPTEYQSGERPSMKEFCRRNFFSLTKTLADNCDYLFYSDGDLDGVGNKYIYDKWVTSLIFGCIIILLNLGLAVFGFLMFKESGGSSGPVTIQ